MSLVQGQERADLFCRASRAGCLLQRLCCETTQQQKIKCPLKPPFWREQMGHPLCWQRIPLAILAQGPTLKGHFNFWYQGPGTKTRMTTITVAVHSTFSEAFLSLDTFFVERSFWKCGSLLGQQLSGPWILRSWLYSSLHLVLFHVPFFAMNTAVWGKELSPFLLLCEPTPQALSSLSVLTGFTTITLKYMKVHLFS